MELAFYPSDVLKTLSRDVTKFDDELRLVADKLVEVMYACGGVGLAAPQVSLPVRLIAIDHTSGDDSQSLLIMANPRFTWLSEEMCLGKEGCLSLPGVLINVPRSVSCEIEYNDLFGNLKKVKLDNYQARIAQHEIDHTDGIVMLDRTSYLERKLALNDYVSPKR